MEPKPLRDVLLLGELEELELERNELVEELDPREEKDDTGVPRGRSKLSIAFVLGRGRPSG